jgi:hypothetical protein
MDAEQAAPCRHAGAPPAAVVDSVARLIQGLASEDDLLRRHGVTADEYRQALSAAIESVRGSMSASVGERRQFLGDLFESMARDGYIDAVSKPTYGDDTVYRLSVADFGDIAIIQKGCPDGAHSSVRWSAPSWARETYLWWLCDSMRYEPGEHVAKGVNRLRQRFFGELPDTISGIVFHDHLCGTAQRVCPKAAHVYHVGGRALPPPCVYVMPDRAEGVNEWNWAGAQRRVFPAVLLRAFGVTDGQAQAFVGDVGFQRRSGTTRTTISSRFGPGRATTYRS